MKKLALFMGAITLTASLAGCGADTPYRTESEIKDSGMLNVAVLSQDNHFVIDDGVNLTGVEIDLINETAALMGVDVTYQRGFDAEAMMSGMIDIAIGKIDPEIYGLSVARSSSIGTESSYFLSRQGEQYASFDEIGEHSIGYVASNLSALNLESEMESAASNGGVREFPEYETVEDAVDALLRRDINVVLCTELNVEEALAYSDGAINAIVATDIEVYDYRAIALESNFEVIRYINQVLAVWKAEEEAAEALAREEASKAAAEATSEADTSDGE